MKLVVSSVFLLMLFSLPACEKDITVDLPPPESMVVVEGKIESGGTPVVTLTRNAGYFDSFDPSSLDKYIVHDALVIVSDGLLSDTLKELAFGSNKTGIYTGGKIQGQPGRYYSLTITTQGQHLSSVTKIPPLVKLDSAYFVRVSPEDSLGRLGLHLDDPDTIGNYYRVMTTRLNKKYYTKNFLGISSPPDYYPSGNSVYEDRLFNAKKFDIFISRGVPAASQAVYDNNRERNRFKAGDTISVKWMSISREVYQFYRTMEIEKNNNGNPFAAPVTVRSNIKGGLGVWSGLGVTFTECVAK